MDREIGLRRRRGRVFLNTYAMPGLSAICRVQDDILSAGYSPRIIREFHVEKGGGSRIRLVCPGIASIRGMNDRTIPTDCPSFKIVDKIEGALQSLGASLKDVVRTRIYLKNKDHWKPVAQVHGRRFRGILPANTLICADIIGSAYLVEMEAEALLG